MLEIGHAEVTTIQIHVDFEDTVNIEEEFPSIVNTSNDPIFGKWQSLDQDKIKLFFMNYF